MEKTGGIIMVKYDELRSPIKFCSVKLSEVIANGIRLDARSYNIEAKQARDIIENGQYPLRTISGINGMAKSYTCERFKRIWVHKSDLPIFQPSSITDVYPIPDGYISHKTRTNIEALRVHAGQILMTCSGTIGKLSFVSNTLDGKIFSHDLIRITPDIPENAGYIYAYLKTKTGNKILMTNTYGAVIKHIEPEHLKTVLIPDAPVQIKKRISDLIVKSYDLRDEANLLIDEATKMLIEELHFPNIHNFEKTFYNKNKVNTFTVKLSNLEERLDASYHIPIVNAIIEHMEKYADEVTNVGDKRVSQKIIMPERFKRFYVEEEHGKILIGGKQLGELDPTSKKYISSVKHSHIMKKLEVLQNTTLITRSGTIGKTVLVPKHWTHWIPSDHIIRIIPANDDIAGYLSIFLASDYGHQLITRYTYGSVVNEIDDTHVSNIPFPILKNKDTQKQINDIALKANEKKYEAYKKEKEALKIMEEEILVKDGENTKNENC